MNYLKKIIEVVVTFEERYKAHGCHVCKTISRTISEREDNYENYRDQVGGICFRSTTVLGA